MKKTDPIQQTIEAALKEAELHDPSSEDYTTIARNVETLAKAKEMCIRDRFWARSVRPFAECS